VVESISVREGKDEQQLAVLCNNLAATMEKLHLLKEAEELYIRALGALMVHKSYNGYRYRYIYIYIYI